MLTIFQNSNREASESSWRDVYTAFKQRCNPLANKNSQLDTLKPNTVFSLKVQNTCLTSLATARGNLENKPHLDPSKSVPVSIVKTALKVKIYFLYLGSAFYTVKVGP